MQIGWFEDLLSLIHAWTLTSVILYSVFYFLLFQATPLIRVCISASMLCYSYRLCITKLYVIAMELGWCEKFMIITMFQCLWLFTTWFVPVRSLLRRTPAVWSAPCFSWYLQMNEMTKMSSSTPNKEGFSDSDGADWPFLNGQCH